jgi:acetyl-CoA decarbonylase/synthase complex subunit beta
MSFKDLPVDIGIIHEGERIRGRDMQIELGGPREKYKFELVQAVPTSEIKDGTTTIIGPDIPELPEGTNSPFGVIIHVAGVEIEKDLEGVIERRLHEYVNFIEGFMHLNQRYDIHLRLSKKSYEKGLNSFRMFGDILMRLYRSEMPFIEKIGVKFITDPEEVKAWYDTAMEVYEERDARARGMDDSEVDVFYGCSLCQSFAPTHLCVITPQRYANCGAISWFDGRATAKVDPKGPVFEVPVGECINSLTGEYSGVNEVIREKSLGEIERVQLYTGFGYPHTSCGCFEGCAFYIPEVKGYGLVTRSYRGETVNGLSFVILSDMTAGGRQVDGFHGISLEYMRSPKFLIADGGMNSVVWMPQEIKNRLKGFVSDEVLTRIPTEEDVSGIEELKAYLVDVGHPVVGKWDDDPVEQEIEVSSIELPSDVVPIQGLPSGVGFTIILKNAKIRAEKLIIKTNRRG